MAEAGYRAVLVLALELSYAETQARGCALDRTRGFDHGRGGRPRPRPEARPSPADPNPAGGASL